MLDNALLSLLRAGLLAGLAANGQAGIVVALAYDDTRQGIVDGPALYLYKVGDADLGSPARTDVYDEPSSTMIHTETQWIATTWQMQSLAPQDPTDLTRLTAGDVLTLGKGIIKSDAFIETLKESGVGMLRPKDSRNPFFLDDRDQNQADPSFDFTVTHEQVIISNTPVVDNVVFNFNRI